MIPSEADWGDWRNSDLDVQYAHKIFAGKTNADVQPDFARAVIERTDELRWMPPKPFQYYILGLRDHVMVPLEELDAPGRKKTGTFTISRVIAAGVAR